MSSILISYVEIRGRLLKYFFFCCFHLLSKYLYTIIFIIGSRKHISDKHMSNKNFNNYCTNLFKIIKR